jgi:galactokinase
MVTNNEITYSAPGRVCLYGEHQDYLKLNVVPAAVNLRTSVSVQKNKSQFMKISSRDLQIKDVFSISEKGLPLASNELDYLRAIIKVLMNEGFASHLTGLDVQITTQIPIGAGLSSSAALLVSWLGALNHILKLELSKKQIAHYAYQAEHDILGVQCGIMDQYSSALGGLFCLDCDGPPFDITEYSNHFGSLVIGDSQVKRKANEPLSLMKNHLFEGLKKISKKEPVTFKNLTKELLEQYNNDLATNEFRCLKGAITIRSLTSKACNELTKKQPDLKLLGKYLTQQQIALKEYLRVSIKELDDLIQASLSAGAFGAKLTGAGLGGCMIAHAPGRENEVTQAIRKAGGNPLIVKIDMNGVKKVDKKSSEK